MAVKGHPRVIGYLQRAVNHEFNAAQQFTLQAVRAEVWGLPQLAAELREGALEEIRHAEQFIRRMYALGVTPHIGQPRTPPVGRTHAEILRFGLATEAEAIRLYEEACVFCRRIGDESQVELFARILEDERQHYRELLQRLEAIEAKRA
jgi:bacterioferritin